MSEDNSNLPVSIAEFWGDYPYWSIVNELISVGGNIVAKVTIRDDTQRTIVVSHVFDSNGISYLQLENIAMDRAISLLPPKKDRSSSRGAIAVKGRLG